MRRWLLALSVLVLGTALLGSAARPSHADTPPITPEDAIKRLFASPQLDPAWFTPEFLAVVPIPQGQQIVDQYRAQVGALLDVKPQGGSFEMVFERGTARATINLNSSGVIAGLHFGVPVSNDPVAARQQAIAGLKQLPGRVSLLVTKNGADTDAIAPNDRLAVGSTFKLAILAALQDQIAAGKHKWDEVVTLKNDWKSWPSGVLQTWPEGTPLTIQTLASEMISISDNTAADALLDIAGRDAVEKYAPGNAPFLSTREAFTLKLPRLSGLLDRYRAASADQRRAMLTEIDAQPFDANVDIAPGSTDIEWFFSPRDLCGLLDKTAASPVFTINPGVADPSQWRSIAYKGGSEPGVLNLSQQLTAQDGTKYCVSVTWNDPTADQDTLVAIVSPLIGSLK
jgi:beta-lactamase class A